MPDLAPGRAAKKIVRKRQTAAQNGGVLTTSQFVEKIKAQQENETAKSNSKEKPHFRNNRTKETAAMPSTSELSSNSSGSLTSGSKNSVWICKVNVQVYDL